jgi:hypothetical protein
MHAEIALTQAGAAMDLIGLGEDELTEEQRVAVFAAYRAGRRSRTTWSTPFMRA